MQAERLPRVLRRQTIRPQGFLMRMAPQALRFRHPMPVQLLQQLMRAGLNH